MEHIYFGLLAFKKKCLKPWEQPDHIDLSEILEALVQNGDLGGLEVKKRFYEVGTHKGILDLEKYLNSKKN